MFIVPKGSDINTLIYYSDVVIGFFSNFLIEATIMRKPVIRFFPKEISNDPFSHLAIGKIAYPSTVIKELNLRIPTMTQEEKSQFEQNIEELKQNEN